MSETPTNETLTGETPTDAKAQMLARIRRALDRGPEPFAPDDLPPFTSGRAHAEEGNAVALFRETIVRAGGHVRDVRTTEEVAEYLCGLLLPRDASAKVALSEGAESIACGLRASLTACGLVVIPTLREYEERGESSLEGYVRELLAASAGVTGARQALAATGTLALDSADERSRLISLLPPVHVCLVKSSAIIAGLESLCASVAAREAVPQALTLVTGPSRTADIEQTLTVGVHGPCELHVLLYEEDAAASRLNDANSTLTPS